MPNIIKPRGPVGPRSSVQIPAASTKVHVPKPAPDAPNPDDVEELVETPQAVLDADATTYFSTPVVEEPVVPIPAYAPQRLTKEEIAELYQAEIAQICKAAEERAYLDAITQKKMELRECIIQVNQCIADMQASQEEYMVHYVRELKNMAIEIAEKMILTKLEEDDMVLQKLVMQLVSGMKSSNWLRVEISERLVNLVDFLKNELEKPEYHGRASVYPTACMDDTCRVSTEEGTTVATISVQAESLRQAFAEEDSQL